MARAKDAIVVVMDLFNGKPLAEAKTLLKIATKVVKDREPKAAPVKRAVRKRTRKPLPLPPFNPTVERTAPPVPRTRGRKKPGLPFTGIPAEADS